MKLLLIKPLADEHVYSQFAAALQEALVAIGHDAAISDQSVHAVGASLAVHPLLDELVAAKPDAVLSFSSFFGNVALSDGRSLFDVLGVRFLGWQLDHPVYVQHVLTQPMAMRRSIYSNPNHLRFAQAVRFGGEASVMLPGGRAPSSPPKDYGAREYPVLVAATWNGEPARAWEAAADSAGKRLYAGVVARLIHHPEASLLDAFNDTTRTLGLAATLGRDPDFDQQMMVFLQGPLTYLRHADRIAIVRALADSGVPLTILGAGWRGYLGDRPNLTFLEHRVNFAEMAALYGDAKVAINLNAGNGACERAIDAMMAGAAVASDYSGALAAGFTPGEEIAFYQRERPASIGETVGELLESGLGEAMAERGHRKATQSALWRHRAQSLIEFLG